MPRSKKQNEQIKEERRSQILTQALRLFASRGLAATKIADIAAAAGVSQGLIYHYFSSKEEIFTELIRHAYAGISAAARYLEELPAPPAAKIRLAIEGLLRDTIQNEDTARFYLLTAQATGSEAIPEEAQRIIQQENRSCRFRGRDNPAPNWDFPGGICPSGLNHNIPVKIQASAESNRGGEC